MRYIIRQIVPMAAALMMQLLIVSGALASDCIHETYRHNGSLLKYEACDNTPIIITYERPHDALAKHGVKAGAQLFVGRERGDGALSGTMWVYKNGCGKIGFIVRGTITQETIMLKGRVPVRNAECNVVRTRAQSFVYAIDGEDARQAEPGSGFSRAPAPASPSFSCTGRLNLVEKTICETPDLAQLDVKLVTRYKRLKKRLSKRGRRRLTKSQHAWLTQNRAPCGSQRRCIRAAYKDRIAVLKWLTGLK